MNGNYFISHFNIENLGVMNNTCDPERQVSKYLTCKKGIIESKKKLIIREIKNDTDKFINLVLVYNNYNMDNINDDFLQFYYKTNFNSCIVFNYYIVLINNYNYKDIKYTNIKYDDNKDMKQYIKNINNYVNSSFEVFKNTIDNKSITYFMIKPYIIEDCGREFAQQYNLIKGWTTINDEITYK